LVGHAPVILRPLSIGNEEKCVSNLTGQVGVHAMWLQPRQLHKLMQSSVA